MAKDDLTGNMPTEKMLSYFPKQNMDLGLDMNTFAEAMLMTNDIFPAH